MNKNFIESAKEKFVSFLDDYDAQSWPASITFIVVISLGMILNYFGFLPVLGPLASAIVSGLFEMAILAWHIVSSRKRNDSNQNIIAQAATWISVVLAVTMLGVNLFRVGGDTHFENTAYIIVALAAITQVVAYLTFDMADPDKKIARENGQEERAISRQRKGAENAIARTDANMDIVRKIYNALDELDERYKDIDGPEKAALLADARTKLLEMYSKEAAEAAKPIAVDMPKKSVRSFR